VRVLRGTPSLLVVTFSPPLTLGSLSLFLFRSKTSMGSQAEYDAISEYAEIGFMFQVDGSLDHIETLLVNKQKRILKQKLTNSKWLNQHNEKLDQLEIGGIHGLLEMEWRGSSSHVGNASALFSSRHCGNGRKVAETRRPLEYRSTASRRL
jgi:hypothetical protein